MPEGAQLPKLAGARTVLAVPMVKENELLGAILIYGQEGLFTNKQIELVTTFARLFDEVQAKTRDLTEALTYQTGSSGILGVIASSPIDVGPVTQGDCRECLRALRCQ